MQIKDIIVVEGRLKLDAKALDVKAKEEVTDKIYTFPGGPKLTRYLNIPFQATVQRAKTEYYKSNQVSVGQAVDNAIEHYMKNPEEADAENNKPDRKFATNSRPDKIGRDISQADKKRGAQLGNQNARKNFDGTPGLNTAKSIGKAIKTIATGSAKDVGTAFAQGSDIGKDVFKDLDNIATTKNPKQTGRVFGS
jgi:hypothetical protein